MRALFIFSCIFGLSLSACKKDEVLPLRLTKCIGHHGVIAQFPDNSMNSLRTAYDANVNGKFADGVEVDVRSTLDHHEVALHESNLDGVAHSKNGKSCDLQTPISNLSLSQILENCEFSNGEPIRTLSEVLGHFGQTARFRNHEFKIMMDFKDQPTAEALSAIALIDPTNLRDLIVTASLSNSIRSVGTSITFPSSVKVLFTGDSYVPGVELNFDGVDVRHISDLQVRMLHDKRVNDNGPEIISIFDVNDPAEQRHFFDLNVNYVGTDNLQSCLELK